MTPEILAQGNDLNNLIGYYTRVTSGLNDTETKQQQFVSFLSKGNTEIPAGDETTYVDGVRDEMINLLNTRLNERLAAKLAAFEALGGNAT